MQSSQFAFNSNGHKSITSCARIGWMSLLGGSVRADGNWKGTWVRKRNELGKSNTNETHVTTMLIKLCHDYKISRFIKHCDLRGGILGEPSLSPALPWTQEGLAQQCLWNYEVLEQYVIYKILCSRWDGPCL